MPASYLGHLGIEIDSSQAETALKRLDSALASTASSAERTGTSASRSAKGGIDDMERSSRAAFTSIDRLSNKVSEFARSAVEVFALGEAFHKMLEVAEQTKSLSLVLGASTDFIQEMSYAMRTAGQDVNALAQSERTLAMQMSQASDGVKTSAEKFNQLGLNAKELLKLPFEQQFAIIVDKLSKITDQTQQYAVAMELLGRGGKATVAMLREHGGSLESVREEARRLGQVLEEDAINKLHDLGEGLKTAGIAWLNWAAESGGAVSIVIEWLKELATWPAKIKGMWEGMWVAIESDRAQGYADRIKAQNDQFIDQLRSREKAYQDQAAAIVTTASAHQRYMVPAETAELAAIGQHIDAIHGMIAAREKDTASAMAGVGAVKLAADARAKEADLDRDASQQLRKDSLEEARTRVEGLTAITEHTKKASEAGENYLLTLDAEIALLKANYDESFRLTAIRHKVAEADIEAAVAKEKYIEDLKLEKKFSEDLQKINEDQAKALMTLDDEIARQKDLLYLTNEQREIANRLTQAGLESGTAEYESRKKQLESIQEQSKQMDLMKDIASGVRDAWTDAFQSIFDKGASGFSDLIGKIKAWFAKMLAELAAMALAEPVLIPMMSSIAGLMGVSNPQAAAQSIVGQMFPYGNLLSSGAQATGINPMNYLSSLFQTGGASGAAGFGAYAPAQGLSGFTGGFSPAAAPATSWLGAAVPFIGAGLGGWGLGGMMAGLTGGNVMGGNIGGTLGGIGGYALGSMSGIAAGAAMGSVVPVIGTIVGAILGGLLGGLFGGGEPDPYHLSLATNKQFPVPTRPTIKGYEDASSVAGPFGDIGFILRGTNDLFDAASENNKKFLEQIAQIDQAFAQFLNPQEVEAVKKRLQDMNEAEFENSFSAITALKQRFEEMLTAVDPQLKKVYDSLNITADNAGGFAVALLGLRKEVQDLNAALAGNAGADPVQQFIDQIKVLDASLQQAADAGRQALQSGDPTKVLEAEQKLRQSVVARYQYEMQVASQLQQVIEALKASIAQLQQQMYQLRVNQYKDWLDINQRLTATGGSSVTQLDIYRKAGTELLGAFAGETDPAKRLEMLKQGMEIVDQGLAARMAEIDQWVQAQQGAQQQRIAALNAEKTTIQTAAQARINALQQELALVQQWANILSSATSALDQLRYGGANPLSAFARLQMTQTDIGGAADPMRRLQLLQTLAGLGGEAYQRPSPEYQRIYNQAISGITEIQREAQAQAARAAALQEQIAAANDAMAASLAKIDKQAAQLSDQTEIQRQAAQMQADARSEANTYYQWIEIQGAAQYEVLQKQLAGQITANQNALDIAQGQMDALTAGLGFDAYIAQKQAEMAALLGQIRDVLIAIYSGKPISSAALSTVQNLTAADIQKFIPYIKQQLKVA